MKKFRIEFRTSTQQVREMEVEFVSKKSATAQASLLADQLTKQRNEQVLYTVEEIPYVTDGGDLQEPTKQERKTFKKTGGRSQVMFTFRLDADLLEFLSTIGNKGRFINNLLHAKMAEWRDNPDADESTEYLEHTSIDGR